MKKRKGLFLLDALLGLLLLSLLTAAFFPLLSQGARVVEMVGTRARITSDGVFAMDYMVGKIRENLHASNASYVRRQDEYTYYAYTYLEKQKVWDEKYYRFFVGQRKLRLDIYGTNVQPVTGETSTSKEPYVFEKVDEAPIFTQQGKGPLHIHFRIRHGASGEAREYETSVLTYADYYRKGEAGW